MYIGCLMHFCLFYSCPHCHRRKLSRCLTSCPVPKLPRLNEFCSRDSLSSPNPCLPMRCSSSPLCSLTGPSQSDVAMKCTIHTTLTAPSAQVLRSLNSRNNRVSSVSMVATRTLCCHGCELRIHFESLRQSCEQNVMISLRSSFLSSVLSLRLLSSISLSSFSNSFSRSSPSANIRLLTEQRR